MKKTLFCFARVGILFLALVPSQAQTNTNLLVNNRRGVARQYANPQETQYQSNGRVILHQLAALGKKLNHLSVVEPTIYVQIQSELHDYLQGLENHPLDYGRLEIYHSVLQRLTQFEEQAKETIAGSREQGSAILATDSILKPGQQARVRPYALLFRRKDYRSKLLHIITSQKVTIEEPGPVYYLVQCDNHRGFMHNGMIIR